MRQTGTISSWHIRIMYFSCNTIDWCMNVLNWNKLLQNKTTKKNLGSKLLNFIDQKGTGSLTILGHKQPNIQSSKPPSRFINRTPISCNVRWVKFEFYLFICGLFGLYGLEDQTKPRHLLYFLLYYKNSIYVLSGLSFD